MPTNVSDIVNAFDNGQSLFATWRKVPTQTTTSGVWFDLSMSPGNPIPNYYIGTIVTSTALARSTDVGLNHGQNVAPKTKYLSRMMGMTQGTASVPLPMILCDYLMFYGFIDQSTVGAQPMSNTITLPRYPTGSGVKIMPVVVAAPVGGASFTVQYTNQSGVAGRVTPTITCNSGALVNGSIVTSAPATLGTVGPFLPLQANDTGVQLIESINFITPDVGLLALVLVKPLMQLNIYDITAPVENDPIIDQGICPIIQDDAYLNWICYPSGSLSGGAINGTIETYWV
jgi:hypothetical protein